MQGETSVAVVSSPEGRFPHGRGREGMTLLHLETGRHSQIRDARSGMPDQEWLLRGKIPATGEKTAGSG
jgi:hypothetical protein